MNPIPARLTLGMIVLGFSGTAVRAQPTIGYTITIMQQNGQESASTFRTPSYRVDAYVQGTAVTSSTTASFTPASQSTVNLAWNGTNSRLEFIFGGNPSSPETTLPASYPVGANYAWSVGGVTPTVGTIAMPGSFFEAKLVSSTQGTWTTGTGPKWLEVDPTLATTFSWSLPTGFVPSNQNNSINLNISGPGVSVVYSDITGATSYPVAANSFQAGSSYNFVLSFRTQVKVMDDFGTGSRGDAILETAIPFQIKAIPEPGTYTALAGLLVLGWTAARRRRAQP